MDEGIEKLRRAARHDPSLRPALVSACERAGHAEESKPMLFVDTVEGERPLVVSSWRLCTRCGERLMKVDLTPLAANLGRQLMTRWEARIARAVFDGTPMPTGEVIPDPA